MSRQEQISDHDNLKIVFQFSKVYMINFLIVATGNHVAGGVWDPIIVEYVEEGDEEEQETFHSQHLGGDDDGSSGEKGIDVTCGKKYVSYLMHLIYVKVKPQTIKWKIKCGGMGIVLHASFFEITMRGYNNYDYYNVSFMDVYNLPIIIVPLCTSRGCNATGYHKINMGES
ncbi:hypothetical protein LXL04_035416 [Taraxacum kok-saghyz]